jgi:hypothetical protein
MRTFFFMILFMSTASALMINVTVAGEIGGHVDYIEMKEALDGEVQHFMLNWYNTKSVGCDTRMRIDMHDVDGKYVDTAWSDSAVLEPGEQLDFHIYWYPKKEGHYNPALKIYTCQEVITQEIAGFDVLSLPSPENTITMEAENTDDGIKLTLTSDSDIDNVVVVPTKYPFGWVFESTHVDFLKAGESRIVFMEYAPSRWKEEKVTLRAVSVSGRQASEPVEVEVKEERSFFDAVLFPVIIAALVLSILLNLYLLYERASRDHKR